MTIKNNKDLQFSYELFLKGSFGEYGVFQAKSTIKTPNIAKIKGFIKDKTTQLNFELKIPSTTPYGCFYMDVDTNSNSTTKTFIYSNKNNDTIKKYPKYIIESLNSIIGIKDAESLKQLKVAILSHSISDLQTCLHTYVQSCTNTKERNLNSSNILKVHWICRNTKLQDVVVIIENELNDINNKVSAQNESCVDTTTYIKTEPIMLRTKITEASLLHIKTITPLLSNYKAINSYIRKSFDMIKACVCSNRHILVNTMTSNDCDKLNNYRFRLFGKEYILKAVEVDTLEVKEIIFDSDNKYINFIIPNKSLTKLWPSDFFENQNIKLNIKHEATTIDVLSFIRLLEEI